MNNQQIFAICIAIIIWLYLEKASLAAAAQNKKDPANTPQIPLWYWRITLHLIFIPLMNLVGHGPDQLFKRRKNLTRDDWDNVVFMIIRVRPIFRIVTLAIWIAIALLIVELWSRYENAHFTFW